MDISGYVMKKKNKVYLVKETNSLWEDTVNIKVYGKKIYAYKYFESSVYRYLKSLNDQLKEKTTKDKESYKKGIKINNNYDLKEGYREALDTGYFMLYIRSSNTLITVSMDEMVIGGKKELKEDIKSW